MRKRKTKLAAKAMTRPMPGSLFTHPEASVLSGKIDGKLPKTESLPFVKVRRPKGTGYCYWDVKPSGDYGQDCETGIGYALMLLPFLKYNFGITLLGLIVLDMIKSGADEKGSGLVVGFMAELSRQLSSTRASLALFAAAAFPGNVSPRHKAGARALKEAAAKTARQTIKSLGSVI